MKRHARLFAVSVLALIAPVTACSTEHAGPADAPTVAVTGASVIKQASDGEPYITMTLTTSAADRLMSVQVNPDTVADAVTLTAPIQVPTPDPDADPTPLTPGDAIDSIELAGGQATAFAPGSYGMWLSGPKKLKTGSTVTITLTLEKAGDVEVQAPVDS